MMFRVFALFCLLIATALSIGWCSDTAHIELLSAEAQDALVAISEVDQDIYSLKGREIVGTKVREVEHVARLDPSALSDASSGCFVKLLNATIVDPQAGFAEFRTPASSEQRDLPRIEFSMVASSDESRDLYVVVFNIHSFANRFSHDVTLTVDSEQRGNRRVKGLDAGNHRVPRHFSVDSKSAITVAFQPAVAARWWFGSCDVYRLR